MKKEEIEEKLELIKKYADNLAKERAGFLFGWQYKGEAHCDETTDIKLFADQIKELLKSEKEKLLERIRLKKWERTKRRDVIATEMNRIMCETRNNTIKELEKLKEEINKEL